MKPETFEMIVAGERARCIAAILNWPGLTEDEKRIAVMAINQQPTYGEELRKAPWGNGDFS